MSPRLVRARRLIEMAESAEQQAQARAAHADRALAIAREEAVRAEARWVEAAAQGTAPLTRGFELEDHAAFLRTLRTRADAAAKRVADASAEHRRRAAELAQATIERRKLELWRDRIAKDESDEEARKERIAADEVAARIVLRSRP